MHLIKVYLRDHKPNVTSHAQAESRRDLLALRLACEPLSRELATSVAEHLFGPTDC